MNNRSVIVYCAPEGFVWRHLENLKAALGLDTVVKDWSGNQNDFVSTGNLYILHNTTKTVEWKRGGSGVLMLSAEQAKAKAIQHNKKLARETASVV